MARSYSYLHLDVFTSRHFEGNQLAVFPLASGLGDGDMQKIAREMAFSETTFVLPPEAQGTDMRMRIFTPRREIPIAGHPTIGSAFALAHAGVIKTGAPEFVFGLNAGPTPVELEWEEDRLTFAWMRQPGPTFGAPIPDRAAIAGALGLEAADLEPSLPVQIGSAGMPFLYVPLGSRQAVDGAQVDVTLGAVGREVDLKEMPVFVFTVERDHQGEDVRLYSRMFAPMFGIPEDPATGAASGPLGAYLLQHGVVTPEEAQSLVSLQGAKMGRPSHIHIAVARGNTGEYEVRVGGGSVVVGGGSLQL